MRQTKPTWWRIFDSRKLSDQRIGSWSVLLVLELELKAVVGQPCVRVAGAISGHVRSWRGCRFSFYILPVVVAVLLFSVLIFP